MAQTETAEFDEDALERAMAHLITEDDTPVDNRFSERQQHLLPDILFASWPEGKPFEALSNVGLFTSITEQAVVPDFMLSLGVHPRPVSEKKADRSYMTWVYGKPPDLVVEVVSNRKGGELKHKKELYAKAGVTYYVVFDPFLKLGKIKRELRTFVLSEGRYIESVSPGWLPEIGLGLTLWDGTVGDVSDRWLRFVDSKGRMLLTSQERIVQETERAQEAQAKAEEAEAKAEEARAKAEEARAKAEAVENERDFERLRAERAEQELAALKAEMEALRKGT